MIQIITMDDNAANGAAMSHLYNEDIVDTVETPCHDEMVGTATTRANNKKPARNILGKTYLHINKL